MLCFGLGERLAGEQVREKLGLRHQGPAANPVLDLHYQFTSLPLELLLLFFLIQFYFQNVGKWFSTAVSICVMSQYSENIIVFSAFTNKTRSVRCWNTEGTMTCISSMIFTSRCACPPPAEVLKPSWGSGWWKSPCSSCCFTSEVLCLLFCCFPLSVPHQGLWEHTFL